jgi:DNA-binding transcriptional LysR family regulator
MRLPLTPWKTFAGAALLPFAQQLAALSVQAREAVAAATGATAGTLAVGASQTIGQYLLPRLIAGFLGEHPRVEVSIIGGNTQTVLEQLRSRAIQVALIEGPALGHDVRVQPFMEDHMVCVVPAGHAWADAAVSLAELRHATLLTREHGSGSRRIVEHSLESAGVAIRDLKLGLTFDSTEGLLSAVEAGLGIAFVSRWAVRNQLALGSLRLAHVEDLPLQRMFSLAWPAGPEPAGVAAAFRRLVLDRAETLTPRPTGRPANRK